MARSNIVYRITVTNWKKYNSNRKKSFRSVMIDERFLDDTKIESLTPCGKLLFLCCLLAGSQSAHGQSELSPKLIQRQTGLKPHLVQSQLQTLQSLQLISYEKIDLLLNRNEMNRNEVEREIEKNDQQPPEIEFQETQTQEPEKKLSSAQRQELSYDPLYGHMKKYFEDIRELTPKRLRDLPALTKAFGTIEAFEKHKETLKTRQRYKELRKLSEDPLTNQELKNYIIKSILDEAGLIEPSRHSRSSANASV